jgi:nucleoside-diphosphate-sugar epimerase
MRHPLVKDDFTKIAAADIPWQRLAGKNILITGAYGFLASYLVETVLFLNDEVLKKPCAVFALVRDRQRARERFAYFKERVDLHFLEQDVSTPITAEYSFDFIIHAASQAAPRKFMRDPIGTILSNTVGTNAVLECAERSKTESIVFVSSSEVYGDRGANGEAIAENMDGVIDLSSPRACYPESKRLGEIICRAWHHTRNVPVKIARLFHTYGPGMSSDDGRVQADFVHNVVNKQDIIIKSDGRAARCFCYLADVTRGIFTVLLQGASGEAYNIGNRKAEITIKDLAQLLVILFPERQLKMEFDHGISDQTLKSAITRSVPNTDKLESLGWRASVDLREGFERTVRSYWDE